MAGGCAKSAPPPGKVVALDQVCNEPDHGRVRLTGYVRYRREMLSFCSTYGGHKTCDLQLSASAAAPPDFDLLHPQKGPEPVALAHSLTTRASGSLRFSFRTPSSDSGRSRHRGVVSAGFLKGYATSYAPQRSALRPLTQMSVKPTKVVERPRSLGLFLSNLRHGRSVPDSGPPNATDDPGGR